MAQVFDIVVRESGIEQAKQSILSLGQEARLAQGSIENLSQKIKELASTNLSGIINQVKNLTSELSKASQQAQNLRINPQFLNANTSLNTISGSFNQLNRSITNYNNTANNSTIINNNYADSANRASVSTNLLAGSIATLATAGFGSREIIAMSDAYINLQNRINSVSDTQNQSNEILKRTFEIAQKTKAPVEEVGTAFARFQRSLAPLGYTTKEIGDTVETVTAGLKIGGATAAETGSVLLQLSQAFQSGKTQGQEFNALAEGFPGFGLAIAKALNIEPVGNFMGKIIKLKEEGALTNDILMKAFAGTHDNVVANITAMDDTFSGVMQNLKNNATSFFGTLDEGNGILSTLKDGVILVSNNFETFGAIIGTVVVTAVGVSLVGAFNALTTAMLANPISALPTLFFLLVGAMAQSEVGLNVLKNAFVGAFNVIYNVVALTSNSIMAVWNGLLSSLSSGLALFGQNASKAVAEYKGKTIELRNFNQGFSYSGQGDDKKNKGGFDNFRKRQEENNAVIQKGIDLAKKSGDAKLLEQLQTDKLKNTEKALTDSRKLLGEESKKQEIISTIGASLAKHQADDELASHRRRVDNLKKEATGIKDVAKQQSAVNALKEENYQASLLEYRGKEGFKGATTSKDVEDIIKKSGDPSLLGKLRAISDKDSQQILNDATQRMGIGSAIKTQNAKPKAPPKPKKEPMTVEDYFGQSVKQIENNIREMEVYGLAREQLNKEDRISEQLMRNKMKMEPDQIIQIKSLVKAEFERKAVYAEVNKLYAEGKGQEEAFIARQQAITEASQKGLITDKQRLDNLRSLSVEEANYRIIAGKSTEQDYVTINNAEKLKASEEIYSETLRGTQKDLAKLAGQEEAWQRLRKEGAISQDKYNSEMIKGALQKNQALMDSGKGTLNDSARGGLLESVAGFRGALPELQTQFGGFFTNLQKGFSDSLGNAIVMGEDLKKTLSDVARQGLAELLSGLIKIGIQWATMQSIKSMFGGGVSPANSNAVQSPNNQVQGGGVGGLFSSGMQAVGSLFGGGQSSNPAQTNGMVGANIGQATQGPPTQAMAGFSEATKKTLTESGASFTSFFSTIGDGFTKVFGNATQKTQDLNMGLEDIAMNGLNAVVQGLIQMGLQWVATQIIGATVGAAATASSMAEAGIVAGAWAPAAALASLATLGANAVPAGVALTTTTGLASALTAVGGFKSGGYTGNGGVNQVAGVVHGKEFVMNASATQRNRPALEAMNRGGSLSGSGSAPTKITVNNYGTPQNYQVEQISRDEIRLIARDESEAMVNQKTPRLIANQIRNPNSHVSKALGSSTKVQRRRNA